MSNLNRNLERDFVRSIASTTLRLIVPTLGLFFVGLAIDALLQQPPYLAIGGAVLGFVVAAWLVYQQIRALRKKYGGSDKSVFADDAKDKKPTNKTEEKK